MTLGDDRAVQATYVAGNLKYSRSNEIGVRRLTSSVIFRDRTVMQ